MNEGLFEELIDTLLNYPDAYLKYLQLKGRDTRFTNFEEIKGILSEARKDFLRLVPENSACAYQWFQKWMGEK